jgi:nickel/cobalt transporter (NicO) family protein
VRRLALPAVILAVAACAALARPGGASAHPLGNFTVNHYAGIELAGKRVYVEYVLDLAEIPSFQSGDDVRTPGYAATLARRLDLRLDGKRTTLVPVSHRVSARRGAGGLDTIRFEAVYSAPLSGNRLTFVDRAFPDRIGWREITLVSRDGTRIHGSTVPRRSASDELRAYPGDLLASPLDVRSATARFTPGDATGSAPSLDQARGPVHSGGGFESLIDRGELSLGVVLVSLLVAAFWGAAHALTPGHGKALVAGYLVGTRGRPRHAFVLGATVTVTHTAGVFALGLVTLLLSQFLVPEQLYPWLTLVSGLLVVGVGAGVLRSRLRTGGWHRHTHAHAHVTADPCGSGVPAVPGVRLQSDTSAEACVPHRHDHHHHHHHGPRVRLKSDTRSDTLSHTPQDAALTSRGLLGVGIAAGLLPCPSALVVLLGAIAVHRVAFGLALIVAFSVGLAATITAIGLAAVLARRAFSRARFDGPVIRALPAFSALVILAVGMVITVRAIPGIV